MKVRNNKGMSGVKALIATASVAATFAAWALLPANDPQGSAEASQESAPAAISAPITSDRGQAVTPSQPLGSLPLVSVPQSSGNAPSAFTHTRSSR